MASLHYKFATMNSGKSTQLIQAHFNYLERGMNPLAMTPVIDDRFGVGVIRARVGLELKVEVFSDSCDLFEMIKAHFAALYARRPLALSMEIVEFSEAGTWKHNNIHARYKKS